MSLTDLQSQGLLDLLDVELARALGRMETQSDPAVDLAIALTSRSIRLGHTCFPIALRPADVWPTGAVSVESLPDPARWEDILRKSQLTRNGPLVLDGAGRLYLRRYWQLEQDVAEQLWTRSTALQLVGADPTWLNPVLDRLFPGGSHSPQRRAAVNALQHRVSLLCGGPGTGKTTTVAAIVALLIESRVQGNAAPPSVMLLAPTGKASARLGQAVRSAKARIRASDEVLARIPEQATTIHRALGMQREGLRFRRSADLPIEADIIVVDEASMIDLVLMRQLLVAAPRNATLLIVGDPDQLTSVEAGSVLRDLVQASAETWWSGRVTHLTKTYRYDEEQPLGQLVAAIRTGEAPTVDALLTQTCASDVVAWAPLAGLPTELDRAAAHWSAALRTKDPSAHFDLRSRYVMLTPFRSGQIGTRTLGAAIQERLAARVHRSVPRVTPIIVDENSYELGVYNGDFAMLVDGKARTAIVQSDTEDFPEIAEARMPRFSEAYALSIHKAQGSEFDEVLVVLPEEDAPLLTRELFYTAVSRARRRVRVVGPLEIVSTALERRARRHSGLVDAIAELRN